MLCVGGEGMSCDEGYSQLPVWHVNSSGSAQAGCASR